MKTFQEIFKELEMPGYGKGTALFENTIKQAIEWIKQSQSHITFLQEDRIDGDEVLIMYERGRISALVQFFNLTEEDIK